MISRLKYAVCWLLATAALTVGVHMVLEHTSPVSLLSVSSGSMEPTLPKGSLIMFSKKSSFATGDIITFRADDAEVVTHRLVKIADDGSLLTKGDANPTPDAWDDPVTKADVMGKVIYMTPATKREFWTTPSAFWTTPQGIGFVACLLAMAMFYKLWRVDESNQEEDESLASTTPA